MDVSKLFDNVTALNGVEGVWLLDAEGVAHVRRLPASIQGDPLEHAREHIRELYTLTDRQADSTEDWVLKYDQRCLLLRRAGPFVLVVLTRDTSTLVALRMVTNVLVRNLTPETVGSLTAPPAAITPPEEPAAPAVAEDTPLAPSKGVRMYRGRPY